MLLALDLWSTNLSTMASKRQPNGSLAVSVFAVKAVLSVDCIQPVEFLRHENVRILLTSLNSSGHEQPTKNSIVISCLL